MRWFTRDRKEEVMEWMGDAIMLLVAGWALSILIAATVFAVFYFGVILWTLVKFLFE